MTTKPSIFTLEELDRMLFERIRLAVVDAGYLPDQLQSSTVAQWEQARELLRNSLPEPKQLIDVYGVSTATNKDEITSAKIVLVRKETEQGSIGAAGVTYFEKYKDGNGDTKFNKLMYPEETRYINYEVWCTSDNVVYDRKLAEIVTEALGYKRYVKTYDFTTNTETDKEVFLQEAGERDYSKGEILERVYFYRLGDVFLQKTKTIRTNIAELKEVVLGVVPTTVKGVEDEDKTNEIIQTYKY